MTLSQLLQLIRDFNNKPGVGFNPRVICLPFDKFDAIAQEIKELERTSYNPSNGEMWVSGIKVVLISQTLTIKK